MKYAVLTFGCRVNQADSLGFEEEFLARGGVAVDPARADVVIVNTCSVTASADQAARQTVRRIARENPTAKIVVTGCYATRKPDELAALPHVTHVAPNDDKPRLIEIVRAGSADTAAALTTAERFGDGDGHCGATIEPGVAGRTAFTLRVQTGCDEPCSYCIIPTTRGRPASVPLANLQKEVARVIAAGFKEIALTGVHLGSYGRELSPCSSLFELLETLACGARDAGAALGGQVRFRVSSLEPMDCTPDIVDLMATSDAFAPHFHLPLQHASDRVLRAMRRPYTLDRYRTLVDGIRSRIPHASIGSDVIVGFPGEQDDDFAQLVAYLESSPLTHVHVFPYSDRPGTDASTMTAKVHGTVVRERSRTIREIAQRLTMRFRLSQVGTIHRGLTLEDGSLIVTGNYLKVGIPSGHTRNEWVDVRLIDGGDGLRGEVLTSSG